MSRLFFKNVDRSRVYIPDLKERGFDTERLIIYTFIFLISFQLSCSSIRFFNIKLEFYYNIESYESKYIRIGRVNSYSETSAVSSVVSGSESIFGTDVLASSFTESGSDVPFEFDDLYSLSQPAFNPCHIPITSARDTAT